MPWTSEHTKWLIETGERLKTADDKEVGNDPRHAKFPGEVAVCLRLYAEINHTAIPGRVLYGAH